MKALRAVSVTHPLRREQVGIAASVGYTLYPQDLGGNLFVRPSAEQARLILRKARLAAALANESPPALPGRTGTASVMGFGRILAEGGRVLENLPLSRVMVSLGADMHAREGQRFSVWSTRFPGNAGRDASSPLAPLYKGEIVLMEVHATVSQAEIIHLGEPGWSMEPGDLLVLLPEEQGSHARERPGETGLDPATGLLRHGDFLARWAEERTGTDSFALALVRLAPREAGLAFSESGYGFADGAEGGGATDEIPGATPTGQEGELPDMAGGAAYLHPGRFMAEAVRLCKEDMKKAVGSSSFGGRYGLNSLIFFHPSADLAVLPALYENLAREI